MAMGFNKGMFLLFVTFGVASAFAPDSSELKNAVVEWNDGITTGGSFGGVDISEWDTSGVLDMKQVLRKRQLILNCLTTSTCVASTHVPLVLSDRRCFLSLARSLQRVVQRRGFFQRGHFEVGHGEGDNHGVSGCA